MNQSGGMHVCIPPLHWRNFFVYFAPLGTNLEDSSFLLAQTRWGMAMLNTKMTRCADCGAELPKTWRPVGTRTCVPVCPTCAAKHMQLKSSRRKAVAAIAGPKA